MAGSMPIGFPEQLVFRHTRAGGYPVKFAEVPSMSLDSRLRGNDAMGGARIAKRVRIKWNACDYRVQFKPDEPAGRIVIEKIGHRDGFYDE
jgi:hypothetical protein